MDSFNNEFYLIVSCKKNAPSKMFSRVWNVLNVAQHDPEPVSLHETRCNSFRKWCLPLFPIHAFNSIL